MLALGYYFLHKMSYLQKLQVTKVSNSNSYPGLLNGAVLKPFADSVWRDWPPPEGRPAGVCAEGQLAGDVQRLTFPPLCSSLKLWQGDRGPVVLVCKKETYLS